MQTTNRPRARGGETRRQAQHPRRRSHTTPGLLILMFSLPRGALTDGSLQSAQHPRAPLEVSTPGDVCALGQPRPGPRNPVQVAAGSEPGPTFHVQEELRGAGAWTTTWAHGLLGAGWVHPAYPAPPTRPAGWTGASRAHDGCSHLPPQHAGCRWTDRGPTLGSGSPPSTSRLGSNLGPALGHPPTPGDTGLGTQGR